MLKVLGNAYSQNKEDFVEIVTALTNAGLQVAYINESNVTIIKEVADPEPEE